MAHSHEDGILKAWGVTRGEMEALGLDSYTAAAVQARVERDALGARLVERYSEIADELSRRTGIPTHADVGDILS